MARVVHFRRTWNKKINVAFSRRYRKEIVNSEIFANWLKSIANDPSQGLKLITPANDNDIIVSCMPGFQVGTFQGVTKIWELDSQNETIPEPYSELPFTLAQQALEELILFKAI